MKGPQPMDAEAQEKLRSLGYLGSPAQSTAESLKVDPKDMGRLVSAIGQGFRRCRAGFQEALRLVVPVVQPIQTIARTWSPGRPTRTCSSTTRRSRS